MSSEVYANGREISAKKDGNKIIAAMPDVCLSPPSPPAGPVPIPYPNFSQDSDTSSGTRSVFIKGKEVGQKNSSNFKKSRGDEAATRTLGMGVVTHTIQGKTKHAAWSFDVKAEGKNVTRHFDIATINHINTGNSGGIGAKGSSVDKSEADPECQKLDERNRKDRDRLPDAVTGSGNTNTNYNFKSRTPGVSSRSRAAHSKVVVANLTPETHDLGNPASQRLKKSNPEGTSNVACEEGSSFRYSGEFFKGGHSEPRILETLFKNSAGGKIAGTLTMKINWQPTGGGSSCAPCPHCHALLCAAAACGLEIIFCTKDNKKVPLDKDADCEKDLDMRKPEVQNAMTKKNNELLRKLGELTKRGR